MKLNKMHEIMGRWYSLLWANDAPPLDFACLSIDSNVAGVFLARSRELLPVFRKAEIPVVLFGGEPPPKGFPCDLVGVNRFVRVGHGRRVRLDGRCDPILLQHGELLGDVALRLMLQRLHYTSRHPPVEVLLDLPGMVADRSPRRRPANTRK